MPQRGPQSLRRMRRLLALQYRRYRHELVHAPHKDVGLQPERTVMSWGRTMLALTVVSAVYLRWWPYHGAWVLVPIGVALTMAGAIYLTQRARYARQGAGIHQERVRPDVWAVLWTTVLVSAMAISMVVIMVLTGQH